MSMALQAFQYKRKFNKAIKDVKSNAPFMGKSKSSAKQESSSWMSSITGKKPDDAKKEPEAKAQDSQLTSFLPWHKQNVEADAHEEASPDEEQPESSEVAAAKDGDMEPNKDEDDGVSNEKKHSKRKTLFRRRNRHAGDNGVQTNKQAPSPSKGASNNNGQTKSTTKKKEKKNDDDDDWWMDGNDSESENDAHESSHHKKVMPDDDDEPEYNPRAEAEYVKSSGGGSSWWE